MEKDKRFRQRLSEQAERERRRLGVAPTAEEVLALIEGRLEGEELDRVADGISAFPETARLARALRRFPEIEPGDGRIASLQAGMTEGWRRLRSARLDRTKEAAAPPGSRVTIAASARVATEKRPRSSWRWSLAAGLVGLIVGFTASRVAKPVREQREPSPNPVIRTLPREGSETRGVVRDEVSLSETSGTLVLLLPYLGRTAPGSRFRLSVIGAGGETLWHTDLLSRHEDGTFTVEIPRSYLSTGRYVLELSPASSDSEPIASYTLDLRVK